MPQIDKATKMKRPRGKCLKIFDFNIAPVMRSRSGHGGNYRLEHYFFRCYGDGSYEFEFQEGWNAGSHYDGGTACNEIPEEWLSGTFEEFVEKFSAEYPAKEYFLSAAELLNNPELKTFMGF